MSLVRTSLLVAFLFSGSALTACATEIHIDSMTGFAFNSSPTIRMEQSGFDALAFRGRFESKEFEPPLYWAVRIAVARRDHEFGGELLHHKLHLKNPPPEVANFSISHGFNIVSLQYGRSYRGFVGRLGLGVVIGHPESTVRGLRYDEGLGLAGRGYHLIGPAWLLGLSREVPLLNRVGLLSEIRWTGCPIEAPIADGETEFTVHTLHVMFGLQTRLF